ncbi:MAG TPA: type VI secretion system accessory protein TagJ [Aliidongia sp.]|nr:type VI secretion system accessory protein TagJ [Aliidongia sp.]
MQTSEAGAFFHEGKLAEAIAAANAAVKQSPTDLGARLLLAELLLFDGKLERADTMLDAAASLEPEAAMVLAEFRQLLRAEQARRQVLSEGRVPEFLGEPTSTQTHLLQALVALRNGDAAAAAEQAQAAEAARPAVTGTGGDARFSDFRDADDLCAGNFEVLTTTGKYFWIPTERVVSMEFHPAKRPRDLYWRRCSMIVRDGPDGDVYLPALYPADDSTGHLLRLGRGTEWSETAPVRGTGQRLFLVGEEGVPMQQLDTLEFASTQQLDTLEFA